MKKDFGSFTHAVNPTDPQKFRAIGTGIGQSQAMSEDTGRRRAQYVVDCMSPEQRAAVPPGEGYPPTTAERMASDVLGTPGGMLVTADYPAARRGRGN